MLGLFRGKIAPEKLPAANLTGAFFDTTTHLDGLILGDEQRGVISLVDVSWGNVNLAVVDWAPVKMLGDERNAHHQELENRAKKDRNRVLTRFQAAVRANRQLAIALQAQGLNEDAARFAYRAQVLQKRVFWFQMTEDYVKLRSRVQVFGAWLFSWFLFLLAGYGYKPWRSFLAYLIVILGFATAYFLIGHTVGPSLSPLGSFVFSMTSFHGRGFSPGENIGLSNPLTILAAIEAFVGLIIEITLVATLTQRFFRK